ncbi:MAG: hypothetical protein AVDCRST_MAG77-5863, partial [uncultured Chloroflexi bacterium]
DTRYTPHRPARHLPGTGHRRACDCPAQRASHLAGRHVPTVHDSDQARRVSGAGRRALRVRRAPVPIRAASGAHRPPARRAAAPNPLLDRRAGGRLLGRAALLPPSVCRARGRQPPRRPLRVRIRPPRRRAAARGRALPLCARAAHARRRACASSGRCLRPGRL